jgi:hypothetical protein
MALSNTRLIDLWLADRAGRTAHERRSVDSRWKRAALETLAGEPQRLPCPPHDRIVTVRFVPFWVAVTVKDLQGLADRIGRR